MFPSQCYNGSILYPPIPEEMVIRRHNCSKKFICHWLAFHFNHSLISFSLSPFGPNTPIWLVASHLSHLLSSGWMLLFLIWYLFQLEYINTHILRMFYWKKSFAFYYIFFCVGTKTITCSQDSCLPFLCPVSSCLVLTAIPPQQSSKIQIELGKLAKKALLVVIY